MKNLYLILFIIHFIFCLAQPPKKFHSRFGGSGYEYGYDVKQTLDKGYIITGSTSSFGAGNSDMYLLKTDSMGQKKFEVSFGNYNNDIGKSVIQLIDSSYVIVGYTNSTGFGGYDIFIVKADKTGTLLWQKTIGGSDWDFAYSLQQTTDGGFIIAGTTYSNGYGGADGYVIKTDPNGNITWTKHYGGLQDDEFKSIIQTSDGNYALCGYTKSYADANGDAWVFKLNGVGDSIHSQTIGGSYYDYFNNVIQLPNGNLYFAGANFSQKSGVNSINWQLAIDNTTNSVYFNNYIGNTNTERYNSSAVGLNGDVISVGYNGYLNSQSEGNLHLHHPNLSYYVYYQFGLGDNNEFFSVIPTKDKGYAAVGSCSGSTTLLNDILFVKLDSLNDKGINITSIKENQIQKIDLIVYPNPTNGLINVSIDDVEFQKDLLLTIIDVKGSIAFTEKLTSSNSKLNIETINSGMYFIQISNKTQVLHHSKLSVIK